MGGKRGDGRAAGVRRYAADLGDVLEGAGVGCGDDELLAEGLDAAFGGGGHGWIMWNGTTVQTVRSVSRWRTIISL
jgi:hypothetical protein